MVLAGLIEDLSGFLTESYNLLSGNIPNQYKIFISLLFYTILIFIYALFIWKFYRFLARRDILKLNLNRYNRSEHPVIHKFFASLFFLLEYFIIVPVVVFFWFSILSLFLLILSETQSVSQILLISALVIASTRLTAYYNEDLSKDIAKMFPFTLLAVFLLNPGFFSLEKLITRLGSIPSFLNNILAYFVFIAIIEIIMRFLFTIIDFTFSTVEQEVQQ